MSFCFVWGSSQKSEEFEPIAVLLYLLQIDQIFVTLDLNVTFKFGHKYQYPNMRSLYQSSSNWLGSERCIKEELHASGSNRAAASGFRILWYDEQTYQSSSGPAVYLFLPPT